LRKQLLLSDDTVLLAYLDAELPRAAARSTKQHLQTCWKCRAALAELELQAQAASKLLNHQDESDIMRAKAAKAKFLERKALFEIQTRRSVTSFTKLLDSQRSRRKILDWFEQAAFKTA
jgi:anti-sigma factor RsiW